MRSYFAAFVFAALLSALLTPLVRRLAFAVGAVSRPGGRHIHGRVMPRFGGIAVALAFAAPLLLLFVVDSSVANHVRTHPGFTVGLLLGGAALCVMGAIDDTRGLRAEHKLAVQVLAASAAFYCGYRIEAVYIPFLGPLSMGVFALPVTVLWIVGVVNAVNLIDGLDGLASGVVFFAAFTNLVVALLGGQVFVALLMSSMLGALAAFLFYNFNPARIFLGDCGSYFLGFVLATTSLAGASQKASTAVSLLVPMVALGVPIFDTLFSMLRRALERRSLFSADRGHIHHRLLDMGLTHRRAVLALYGVSIVLTAAAIGISLDRRWEAGAAMLVSAAVFIGLVRFVGVFDYFHARRRQKARLYDMHTEALRSLLPEILLSLREVRSEADLSSELERLVKAAHLTEYAIVSRDGRTLRQSTYATKLLAPASHDENTASVSFPLGPASIARSRLRFRWLSDQRAASPQADILLQVVADAVAGALTRLGSNWAPATPANLTSSTPVTSIQRAQAGGAS